MAYRGLSGRRKYQVHPTERWAAPKHLQYMPRSIVYSVLLRRASTRLGGLDGHVSTARVHLQRPKLVGAEAKKQESVSLVLMRWHEDSRRSRRKTQGRGRECEAVCVGQAHRP